MPCIKCTCTLYFQTWNCVDIVQVMPRVTWDWLRRLYPISSASFAWRAESMSRFTSLLTYRQCTTSYRTLSKPCEMFSHVTCRHVLCNSTFVSTVTTRMEKLKYQGFWQWHIRDFTKNLGNVREQILSEKSGLKPFTVSCIFAFILDFVEFVDFILVSDHTVLHCCPHHWQ